VGQVGQDHRPPGQQPPPADDLSAGPKRRDGKLGEHLVQALGRAQFGQLGVDDHGRAPPR
jgi:hypothetical protein